jgi:L-threonylcarbamoyladenylate synthase
MINADSRSKAVKIINRGGLVIFPTDTVWGLGASVESQGAIKKLYQIKNRYNQPTAVLVASLTQAQALGVFNSSAKKLARQFWPGGLTIVVKAKKNTPQFICSQNKTIGLRMPYHSDLLKFLNQFKYGLVASSANFKGKPAPISYQMIDPRIKLLADYILPGKNLGQAASTVIDTTVKPLQVIREGIIPSKKLLL